MRITESQAAAVIAARLLAVCPADEIADPDSPAGAAFRDVTDILLGKWTGDSDRESITHVFFYAGFATSNYTADEEVDAEVDSATRQYALSA